MRTDVVLKRTQRGETYAGYCDLRIMVCPTCGVLYALPEALRKEAARRGNFEVEWCCPNGHSVGYGENEQERLERRIESAEQESTRLRARLDQSEASERAQRGAATRARKERDKAATRVKGGVCPCCKRHFTALERHMHSKHPDYDGQRS